MPATGDLCTVTPAAFSLYLFLGHPVFPIATFSWCSACFTSKRFFPSQEDLGAPIYWSLKNLFSIFWKGMKRKRYDKTRFCVSREGLPSGLKTFSSP